MSTAARSARAAVIRKQSGVNAGSGELLCARWVFGLNYGFIVRSGAAVYSTLRKLLFYFKSAARLSE